MLKKRALVTGAAAGIGRAVVEHLGKANCQVMLVDIDEGQLASVGRELTAAGHDIALHRASVAEPDSVAGAFSAMDERYGGIDILVNNAGVTGNSPVDELTFEFWQRVLSVNQTGCFLCAQAAGKRMREQGAGVIVNLSSIYGLVAAPHRMAYAATKAAVAMMTKCLAVEWAEDGVRVNCVAPGYVETPGTQQLAQVGKLDLEALQRRTPQQRLATPDDIASAIVTLCDDKLAHVTGQVLAVDGGWSVYGYL
ncbi:MAG: SDR family NAD(P)-dependent oxidoreductase [Pseudomonadota bacterium]